MGTPAASPAVAAPAPDPMAPLPYRVTNRIQESDDVCTIELAALARPVEAPRPGQFVMAWAFGVGEIPISVSRADEDRLALTVRAVGAVSTAIVDARPGDVIGVRGPYGTAWPIELARGHDVVVLAGGLGLAPLRMAIDGLLAARPVGRVTLILGARTPAQLIYRDDIIAWSASGAEIHPTVDTADRTWHGAVGTATAQLERLGTRHELAFVCGPELMMTSAARATVDRGTAPDHVWVSLERNMHCGIAHCGRCQLGPLVLCRDGAVVRWSDAADLLEVRER